ncbi:MAG TPA: DUF5916 domain-containing protein [Thermoanaerobaculia bacterium]|nr:DUF5916 domain-containing protein [Thermoanaerobaculia bacterium]
MKRVVLVTGFLLAAALSAFAAPPTERTTLTRTDSPITIDGDLSDPGWKNATKFETWYETNPGDNIEPKVKTVGWVTYDSRFFYFGIESSDPTPKNIIAPYADHDQISGNTDDYVGVILDTRNDGKTAYLFLVTARGVQYDAVTDDAGNGEDNSPDYFWDSAAKIHANGWTAEARIPFSSLRYDGSNPEQWGMILYRNWPRERRYQMFTNKLPRDVNCFVCNYGKVDGLTNLPTGNHLVLAPYVTAQEVGATRDGPGTEIVNRPVGAEAGLDLKWNPTADMAVDATINPDFSQIESDVAVISTNERFAIFIPEKRPFFLEGIELFSTPIQAVYTRTLTSPRWGARTTGKTGPYAYTLLVAQDRGGGDVILPSAFGSGFGLQDFSSIAGIARMRRDFGRRSFLGLLATTRENDEGGHNRVIGPDFQWRHGDHHTLTGQFLYSMTETPNRPELADEWNGQKLSGHAAHMWYQYATDKNDFYVQGSDYDKEFRADNGFVPQVGWRGAYTEVGHTWRPKGFFSRIRLFGMTEYQETQDGDLLYRLVSGGFGADGKHRSFIRIRPAHESVSTGNQVFDRNRAYYSVQFAVNRILSYISFDGWVGEEIDFARERLGRGASVNVNATVRPTNHLQLGLTTGLRWLNVSSDRLFTSQVERIRATYTFNERMFVRAILQNQRTNRDVDLYGFPIPQHSGAYSNQLLFAYKVNWQTVFYVGYGDLKEVESAEGDFLRSDRQFFAKVSYAFQR